MSEEEQQTVREEMWVAIREGILKSENERKPIGHVISMVQRNRLPLAGIAASLLVLIWFTLSNPFSGEIVIQTDFGEIREVLLPDNSTVLLHGNSSISYAKNWDEQGKRSLRLTGEAYFSVLHTRQNSEFTVYTAGDLSITVLGTKFNVNTRKQGTEVILEEGRVRLDDGHDSYTMKPREMVSHSALDTKFVSTVIKVREKVSWRNRVLIFEDESLGEIAEILRERYGVNIVFENKAWNADPFTGSVPTDSVLLFLDKIKKLYNADVTHENGVYVVR
ncbi:MAG TPA: FecR domain-containing protein [Chryseolinea sp.]|nr:FecR domain-containing protein [Chryseolinea sp.]